YEPTFFAKLSLANLWGKQPVDLALAVLRGHRKTLLAIALAPDWQKLRALLQVGEWSEPVVLAAEGRCGREDHALRFKLLNLDAAPPRIRLFNTGLHALHGHSSPADAWRRHLDQAGPIEEQTDPSLVFSGAIDITTHIERCRHNLDWLRRVSHSILHQE